MSEFDPINKPKHYCEGRKYEPIDVILDWDLNFCLGQVVKYVSRAGRKGDILEDINKALYYLERAKTEIVLKRFDERLSKQKKEFAQEPDICKTNAYYAEGRKYEPIDQNYKYADSSDLIPQKETVPEPDICKDCIHFDQDTEGNYWCTNSKNVDVLQMDGFPTECEFYKATDHSDPFMHRCCTCKYGSKPDKEVICSCPDRIRKVAVLYSYYEKNKCRFWELRMPKPQQRCCDCQYGVAPDHEKTYTTCTSPGATPFSPYLYFEENDCRFWKEKKHGS